MIKIHFRVMGVEWSMGGIDTVFMMANIHKFV